MKKYIISLCLLFSLCFTSCLGDLDTLPLDENSLVSEQVYSTEEGYMGVLAKCYGSLILTGQQGGDGGMGDLEGANEGYSGYVRLLFYLEEQPTDNFLMPSSSNGLRKMLNLQWDASNAAVIKWTYQRLYMSIAYCNEFLRECTESKLKERGLWEKLGDDYLAYRAEARFIRAYAYSQLCNYFGNVSLIDENTGVKDIPAQNSRKEVFEFAEQELKAVAGEVAVAALFLQLLRESAVIVDGLDLGLQHQHGAAENTNLGRGEAYAAALDEGISHVIQKGMELFVEVDYGSAALFKAALALFYYISECHNVTFLS